MPRPAFFNLVQIQMPVGALTSITHRVTGILLALGIPYGVYLLTSTAPVISLLAAGLK